jgi:hypothetical protein
MVGAFSGSDRRGRLPGLRGCEDHLPSAALELAKPCIYVPSFKPKLELLSG